MAFNDNNDKPSHNTQRYDDYDSYNSYDSPQKVHNSWCSHFPLSELPLHNAVTISFQLSLLLSSCIFPFTLLIIMCVVKFFQPKHFSDAACKSLILIISLIIISQQTLM